MSKLIFQDLIPVLRVTSWIAVAILAILAGCTKVKTWTEEVKLSNGGVVLIQRVSHYKNNNASNLGFGWMLAEDELIMASQRDAARQPWKADMLPIILDFDDERRAYVIIAVPIRTFENFEYGIFYSNANGWARGKFEEKYAGRKRNLVNVDDVSSSYIDVAYKIEVDRKIGPNFPYTEATPGGIFRCTRC